MALYDNDNRKCVFLVWLAEYKWLIARNLAIETLRWNIWQWSVDGDKHDQTFK